MTRMTIDEYHAYAQEHGFLDVAPTLEQFQPYVDSNWTEVRVRGKIIDNTTVETLIVTLR
jgi:hypothetical protein